MTTDNLTNVSEQTKNNSEAYENIQLLKKQISQSIVGQENLVERMIVALLCDGHLLVEGAPGLAKTRAIRTLADTIEGSFHRVQFTPDLLPSDLTGTDIYRQETSEFIFQSGPIFNNLVLADEINRAPAKVQSALLEAMAEGQVTVGKKTYKTPELFLVMATQNPIEQEGTYALPEAQLDRFLMHISVGYPKVKDELNILKLVNQEKKDKDKLKKTIHITQKQLKDAKDEIMQINVPESVEEYIVQLICATRQLSLWDETLGNYVDFGSSPRGTIALLNCARALAWLNGSTIVTSLEVQQVAHDVLRHRILLSLEGESIGITTDQVIDNLLNLVPAI